MPAGLRRRRAGARRDAVAARTRTSANFERSAFERRHFSVPEIKDASSIDAALVATVNGLARPKPVTSVTNTADDERRPTSVSTSVVSTSVVLTSVLARVSTSVSTSVVLIDERLDFVSAVFSAPFAEPPRPGSISVFGGSFVSSRGEDTRDAPEGADAEDDARANVDTSTFVRDSFETHPETASRPRDWLKLAQIVATLDAQRGVFARHQEEQSAKNQKRSRVRRGGLRRAMARGARDRAACHANTAIARAAVPGVVARRSLVALSRALGTAARRKRTRFYGSS